MAYAVTAINLALDAITVDRGRLHSGDPGVNGTDNVLGSGLFAVTFNAASGGERLLDADVTITGLAADQPVTHFSLWLNSGTVFRGGFERTSGAAAANELGEYTLKATTTKMTN